MAMAGVDGDGSYAPIPNCRLARPSGRVFDPSQPFPMAGIGDYKERIPPMRTLIEKYTSQADETSDDGVVAIEYVVTAAAIVAALAGLFALGLGDILTDKLEAIVNSF